MIIFEYSLAHSVFFEIDLSENMRLDEEYFLSDILDFLDGRQELYSNFWHKLDPKKIYRLWTYLGANFCNNDRVLKKYRLHFERAMRGESVDQFISPIFTNLS